MSRERPLGGYFYADYAVGDVFRHAVPRTITESDATVYTALTGERHPLHCSKPLAMAMGHRGCPVDDLLVVAAEQNIRPVHERHPAPELMEDAGELVGDITAARDDDPPRQLVEMKGFVGADRMLDAR